MNPTEWLAALSLVSTAALGAWTVRNSRRSTDQASEVTLRGQDLDRLRKVEDRLAAVETDYRDLWYYTRRLLDLYYRHRQPNAPDPEPLPDEPRTT